ncbi:hypothetical protein SCUP515_07538 [Seiridium cupressi]
MNASAMLGNDQPLAVWLMGKFANETELFVQTFDTEGAAIKNNDCAYPYTFPCDNINVSGATLNLLSYLFWANAVPDAETVVNLAIDGAPLLITDGIGHHDKNSGQKSVITSPKYWDWGHARVGPYAIVSYDLLDHNTEHTHAYVSKDGEDPFAGCGGAMVKVRQLGPANMTYDYPPTNKLRLLANTGLLIDYELPSGEKLFFNVKSTAIIKTETGNVYSRGVVVVGYAIGGPSYSGRGSMRSSSTGSWYEQDIRRSLATIFVDISLFRLLLSIVLGKEPLSLGDWLTIYTDYIPNSN